MLWIFVGLGNPGRAYAGHRHNIGFDCLTALQKEWQFPEWKTKQDVALSAGTFQGHKVILACPLRYMNLSGEALSSMIAFYRKQEVRWVVFHDELDLPVGTIRWKRGGGTGGHNGLKSLHRFLGADYDRLRIGVGRPPAGREVSAYVLSSFPPQDRRTVDHEMERLRSLLEMLLDHPDQPDAFVRALHGPQALAKG